MGVRRSDVILLGYELSKLTNFSSLSDFYEPQIKNGTVDEDFVYELGSNIEIGKVCHLEDYMSGRYSLVGIPLIYDKDGYSGLDLFEYGCKEDYIESIKLLIDYSKETFNIDLSVADINLLVLTHWI